MDWKKISEDYPKAWNDFLVDINAPMDSDSPYLWRLIKQEPKNKRSKERYDLTGYTYNGVHHYVLVAVQYPIRNLYDYFDIKDIRIRIGANEGNFSAKIYGNIYNNQAKTRKKVEAAVFTKAFSLLEKQLIDE